jgi:hypothetical protein
MTAEQVKKARDGAPFKPFRLFLSDQRSFQIEHPDFLWIIPGGRNIAVADTSGAIEVIDLFHVSSLRINGANIT